MRGAILPLFLVALLSVLAVFLWFSEPQRPLKDTATEAEGGIQIGGDFTLMDSQGQLRNTTEFLGKYRLVYFGYSFCPDICPTDLLHLSRSLQMLGKDAEQVVGLFITVDPERDTPEHLREVMRNYDPRMVALTGSKEEIETAKKAYKVYSAKATPDGTVADYLVDHSSLIYLIGRDGRYVAHFPHGTKAEAMVERISQELAKEFKQPSEKAPPEPSAQPSHTGTPAPKSSGAFSADVQAESTAKPSQITVSRSVIRSTEGKVTAAYLTLNNPTSQAVALVGASSPVSRTVEIHTHLHEGGVMKMRPVPDVTLPLKGELAMRPGGYHLMFMDVTTPVVAGQRYPIHLRFSDGSTLDAEAEALSGDDLLARFE